MNKYCIRVSRMIEVENLNEVEVFMKLSEYYYEVVKEYETNFIEAISRHGQILNFVNRRKIILIV